MYSKVLQSVLRKLDANYKSFFSLKNNGDETDIPPKYRRIHYIFTMNYKYGFEITDSKANNMNYNSIDTNNYLYSVDKLKYTEDGEIFVTFSHNHPSGLELKFGLPGGIVYDRILSVADEIYQKKDGGYHLSITYNVTCLDFKYNDKYLAMDIGVNKHNMVDSDGYFNEIISKRPNKYWGPIVQQIQSRLDHCKRYSKKWYRLKPNLNRMKQK